tara:strand:+ start:322 stop:465 length:144 start_codon:yes stop_codon:yes gene_type:complete
MKYIWRTFYWISKILACIVTGIIWILVQIKDALCNIKDWFNKKEFLG